MLFAIAFLIIIGIHLFSLALKKSNTGVTNINPRTNSNLMSATPLNAVPLSSAEHINRKLLNFKYCLYYFYDNMINIKDFGSNSIKIDKKTNRGIGIYYIGYMAIRDSNYIKINSVNPLYLIIGEIDGYIEEKNGNEYLVFASIDENKEILKNTQNFGIKLSI